MPSLTRFSAVALVSLLLLSGCTKPSQSDVAVEETQTQSTYHYEPTQEELADMPEAVIEGDPAAQYEIGLQFGRGEGITPDYQKAEYWYTQAAEQGYVDAYYGLAWLYYTGGHGLEQSYEKARKWYAEAVDQEAEFNNDAANSLGYMFLHGLGGPKNYDKAYELFEKAAETGVPAGYCNVGYMYSKGFSVDQDYQAAKEWYDKAIDAGHTDCFFEMGWINEFGGYGLEPNPEQANYWYHRAINESQDKEDIAGAQEQLKSQ